MLWLVDVLLHVRLKNRMHPNEKECEHSILEYQKLTKLLLLTVLLGREAIFGDVSELELGPLEERREVRTSFLVGFFLSFNLSGFILAVNISSRHYSRNVECIK